MEGKLLQYNPRDPQQTVLNNGSFCEELITIDGRRIPAFKCPEYPGQRVICCGNSTTAHCCKTATGVPSSLGGGSLTHHEPLLLIVGGVVSCVLFITTIVVAFCVICKRRSNTRQKRVRSHGGNVINLDDLSDEDLHTRMERPPTYSRSTALTSDMYSYSGHDIITIEPAPSYSAATARDPGIRIADIPQQHPLSDGTVSFNGMYMEPPPPYQEYPDPNSRILVCRHGGTLESHNTDLTVRFQY